MTRIFIINCIILFNIQVYAIEGVKCHQLFSVQKAQELRAQENRQVSDLQAGEYATFEFAEAGLHIFLKVTQIDGFRNNLDLVDFVLDYEPSQFFPGSFFRRVLGNKPMQYSAEDLRYFSANTIYMSYGAVIEFYLRSPDDPKKLKDEGPLLAISLETGKVIGYPKGTDVDGELNGIFKGSAKAILGFLNGLSIEAQNAIKKTSGEWLLASPETGNRIERQPTKLIEN